MDLKRKVLTYEQAVQRPWWRKFGITPTPPTGFLIMDNNQTNPAGTVCQIFCSGRWEPWPVTSSGRVMEWSTQFTYPINNPLAIPAHLGIGSHYRELHEDEGG